MLKPFILLEKGFYFLRELIWNYPDVLFLDRDSVSARVRKVYSISRPYSHFLLATLLTAIITVVFLPGSQILAGKSEELIEGVVIGANERGETLRLTKVNPLLPTSVQLERDLNALIYEPLIRYEQGGSITPVLAESILRIHEGAEYEFLLREGVFWHDGREFGVEDVERTLDIIYDLDVNAYGDSSFVRAIKQMAWERTGERSIRICTTSPDLLATLTEETALLRCSGVDGEKPILSNFLELISVSIMPKHLTRDINTLTIDKSDPAINRFPVGTGPFQFDGVGDNMITVRRNENYHGVKSAISKVEFKLFKDTQSAVEALQNGEVHTFAATSTEYFREIAQYPQITAYKSPVLQQQYWAIYLNQRKDLDGNYLGPSFFGDAKVRQALSAGVDRQRILQTLLGVGVEALGPYYRDSEYFNSEVAWFGFHPDQSRQLLDEAGWVVDPATGFREKEGQRLSFSLSYVDFYDRHKVVESIRQDMLKIGVEVIPDPRSLQELTEQVVTPKIFDALLYGVSTFVDPDRYELFHSSANLNLASYVGSEQTVKIENRQRVNLPRVDRLLELARSFDPLAAKSERKDNYFKSQELIAADAPVIFLYHPQFIYYANNRLQDLDLSRVSGLEQRFRNIANWKLGE